MERRYDACSYKARRDFVGIEFEVRLFDVDTAGVAVIAFQSAASECAAPPLKFSRVFSRSELRAAGIAKTLEGFVALVDSLELVEDAYFTAQDAAASSNGEEFAAFQLSSALPGIKCPPPIVSKQAAMAYFARAPVGPAAWSSSGELASEMLLDVVAKGLAELCRSKPAGLDAVKWLGAWFLEHNPTQPHVEE
ncbi:hypothetical protein PybrP1_000768 [[Pythium] brassicae (nom. inval.)]|nr:hypothetical protein PybrP1_000768 [[Pythium] brassicae (nom. inval.)]